jgi:hypothetical protein
MSLAWFRFYEELNEFLPPEKRKQQFSYSFKGTPSVKDAIEALGVPHVEIDLILVNSISVGFTYKLGDGDQVSVYPVFESINMTQLQHLRAVPLRVIRFVLDVHLGKLTKYLRLCGFDSLYRRDFNEVEIIRLSTLEKRTILTRDKELLKNTKITHGYWIRSQYLSEQMNEVFSRFDLKNQILPFIRCIECNGLLNQVSKEDILNRLQPETARYFNDFRMCSDCERIYWEGSHYERMKKYIDNLIKNVN